MAERPWPGWSDLARALWHAPLPDPAAPGRALEAALEQGARHSDAVAQLRVLRRAALPAADAARKAAMHWPGSVDMGVLAVELAAEPVGDKLARSRAVADLRARLAARDAGRAPLARLWLRMGRFDLARAELAGPQPHSDALFLRGWMALEAGEQEAAARDIAALHAQGDPSRASLLALRADWARRGAAGLKAHARSLATASPGFLAELAALAIEGRDLAMAEAAAAALRRSNGGDTRTLALITAQLALAQDRPDAASHALAAGFDPHAPWSWPAQAHRLWLRSGVQQAAGTALDDPRWRALAHHADAARRLHADDSGLLRIALRLQEVTSDWGTLHLAFKALPDARGHVAAEALLRLGRPGAALGALRRAARARPAPPPAEAMTRVRLRADAFALSGRLECARTVMSAAAPGTRVQSRAHALALVHLDLQQRMPEAAAAQLRQVVPCFPDDPRLAIAQARTAFFAGDLAAAAAHEARLPPAPHMQPEPPRRLLIADVLAPAGPTGSVGHAARSLLERVRSAALPCPPAAPSDGAPIPSQLLFYWQGPNCTAVLRSLRRWQALHPHHTLRCLDRQGARDWLADRALSAPLALFDRLEQPAARADLLRLCLLWHEGGVWADVDEYPRLPVLPWLQGARGICVIEQGMGAVANSFIAAVPQLPLIGRALHHALHRLQTPGAVPNPWWQSGPAAMTLALAETLDAPGEAAGLRVLDQRSYERRVATTLPLPHKRGPDHWR